MRYDEFMAQFDEAHENWGFGKITTEAAAAEIVQLRELLPGLESDKDRGHAKYLLDDFADEISPECRDRMGRASAALNAAMKPDGTIEQQIERTRRGMRTITSIAMETDNESERFAIIRMNSTLGTLVSELEAEAQDQAD